MHLFNNYYTTCKWNANKFQADLQYFPQVAALMLKDIQYGSKVFEMGEARVNREDFHKTIL
jgi:hypothetical protein